MATLGAPSPYSLPPVGSSSRRASDTDSHLSYPRSTTSTVSESPVVRSRTWSEDITKTWNVPIAGVESLDQRLNRYLVYFTMTPDQLKVILEKFLRELRLGLEIHREDPKAKWDPNRCSLKMVDTCVGVFPNGKETGSSYVIDFGGPDAGVVRAVKVTLDGSGSISSRDVSLSLRDQSKQFPKGLLDSQATASKLFDTLATLVKDLVDQEERTPPAVGSPPLPVGFTICFPVEQRGIDSATLIHWVKGYETGRKTNDPVEGMDTAALLNCAFARVGANATVKAVLNDTTGVLLTCAYEKPPTAPSCRVGVILGSGVNGCYIQPDACRSFGYKGNIVNCELGNFDKSLPVNDVDLEVDFADESTKGVQLFEKMVAANYIGELCRRLVVKVWQNDAPRLAWVRQSMPWVACAKVLADTSKELDTTGEVLMGLWEWETTPADRKVVQKLFDVVFDRSAALAAVAIVALSVQTERLQQAMGGLTCGVGGALFSGCDIYANKLKNYLEVVLLDKDIARLIDICVVHDGSSKGAGILAAILERNC